MVAATTTLAVPVPSSLLGVAVGVASGVASVVALVVRALSGTRTGMSWEKEALPQSPSTAGTRATTIASA